MSLSTKLYDELVPASVLKNFAMVVKNLGGNAEECFARFNLDLPHSVDGQYISNIKHLQLLEYSSQALNLPYLGLQIAEIQSLDDFGPITPLVRSAATLREALQYLITYEPIHTPWVSYSLVEASQGVTELCWQFRLSDVPKCQTHEMSVGIIRQLIANIIAADFRPSYVRVAANSPVERIAKMRRSLGFDVLYNEPVTSIAFPTPLLNTRLSTENKFLAGLMQSHLDQMRVRKETSLSEQVESILNATLTTDFCTLNACAKQLCLSPRTLQARLRQEGTSFSELLEKQRCVLAKEYLRGGRMSITEIAGALGYSDQSTFSRAFRGWTGCSPSKFKLALCGDKQSDGISFEPNKHVAVSARERALERENAELKRQLAAQADELKALNACFSGDKFERYE